MNVEKKIYEIVKSLPEQRTLDVLNFDELLNIQQNEKGDFRRQTALVTLQKYRGRLAVAPFIRDDCYDR